MDKFTLPVWVIGRPGYRIEDLATALDADLSRGIVMFREEGPAKAFLVGNVPLAGNVPRKIEDPLAMLGLMVLLEKKGFRHVVLDPTSTPDGTNPTKLAGVLVSGLRAAVEAAFD